MRIKTRKLLYFNTMLLIIACLQLHRYHFRSGFELIQVIGPSLHHFPSFGKVRSSVVGPTVRIVFYIGI